jgi:hypothetical protein
VVLAGESAEDLSSAAPVLSAVRRRRRLGDGLIRCKLAKATVRPGGVVVPQVLGQHVAQVVLVNDQQPVEELPRRVPIVCSQMAFALGACGGLARILMPSARNTASKKPVS